MNNLIYTCPGHLWLIIRHQRVRVQNVLGAAYLMQYLPTLGLAVMKLIGPGRAASLKGGSGGYDIKSMLFSKKAE